jgi:thioredoxin 1
MKKNIVFAIVAVLAVIGVAVIVKFSQGTTPNDGGLIQTTESEANNPASKIEAPEIALTKDNWDAEVRNYKGVVLVDMFLPTCIHCKNMGPIITEIAKATAGKYKVGKLDVNKYSELSTEFGIESVPVFVFIKDGKEMARMVGEQDKQKILDKLAEIAK